MIPRYGQAKYGTGKYGPGDRLDRIQLQQELAGPGNGWTDLTADVRGDEPIVVEYGIQGDTPIDRVASAGQLSYALDNSALNSGAKQGYYAPHHPNKRTGFDYDTGVRLVLRHRAQDYFKFRGRLSEIEPVPGRRLQQLTRCQALDYMDDLARMPVPDLAAQVNQRGDQLVTTMLDALAVQPAARAIETGLDTFPWALDGAAGQGLMAREELQKICLSEQSYAYVRGDAVQGGTFVWEARGHRTLAPVTTLTFTDDMDGCTAPGSREELIGRVRVAVYPTRVDAAATTVLWALQSATTVIQPGQSLDSLTGPYRDPATNEPCGGTAMVTPVATTDYTANAAADGSGADLTGSLSVSATFTGQRVVFTLTNTGGTPLYVTKLQVRGQGVYRSRTVVEETVATGGDRVLELDLPYQNSLNAATTIAKQLATFYGQSRARVRSVTFTAQASEAFLEAAVQREPGDRIAITETVTGLSSALFTIQSVRLEIDASGLMRCTWGLMPWGIDPWWVPPTFAATGGTVSTIDGYTVHTFTADGTFQVTAGGPVTVEHLVVGGGGGGGGDDIAGAAGGGAGGQVVTGSSSVSLGSYAVTVGAGGAGGAQVSTATGASGGNSSFNGLSAAGGSGGAGADKAAGAGTLGGGGGSDGTPGAGSLYSGGSGATNAGGGGAGAGGAGASAVSGTGGDGGPGVTSTISGSSVAYGGGGGGGGLDAGGAASAGGGAGRSGNGAGTNGTANRGGGGGGARFGGAGGNGGSGVVIIRYPTAV